MDRLIAASKIIESGGLVIVPTRRWYMICCDAGNKEACAAIFSAKRRPMGKSLLLVLKSNEEAFRWFQVGRDAATLIHYFWPGDLALLLQWSHLEFASRYSSVGLPTALVSRAGGILGELAIRTSVPIAATSANISGASESEGAGPAICPEEVSAFLDESGARVDLVIQAGICPEFMPMTIVDCSNLEKPAQIAREGTTHSRAIAVALRGAEVGDQGEILASVR
jgi:L-threonylcarbamoyladenylate synthase